MRKLAAATLRPAEPPVDLPAPDGAVEVELDLPMPGSPSSAWYRSARAVRDAGRDRKTRHARI